MIIYPEQVPFEGGEYSGEEPASVLELEDNGQLRTTDPIRYNLHAELVSGELIVRGSVSTKISFECVKCTDFFDLDIGDRSFDCVKEVADETESVDLTPDIREAILLAFPAYPVCRGECRGLCQVCGVNLNREKCSCKPPADFRWEALDGLKV